MTHWLSQPVEALLEACREPNNREHRTHSGEKPSSVIVAPNNIADDDAPVDKAHPHLPLIGTLIVGSGYGAAMAALALSDDRPVDGHDIVVFERGEEFLPEDFPRSVADIPAMFRTVERASDGPGQWRPEGQNPNRRLDTAEFASALWDIRRGKGVVSVTGNGLGGTSLVNAAVASRVDAAVLERWPRADGAPAWQSRFEAVYPKIDALLGVQQRDNPEQFGKYRALLRTARALDPDVAVEAAPVTIEFGEPGPHSVQHGACNDCGNCVIGCHSGAKQSLNLNAWPLARQRGVKIYTGARVITVTGTDGEWRVEVQLSRCDTEMFTIAAKRVILAAGTLGSAEILKRSTAQGASGQRLSLSPRLGQGFSTNGDALVFGVGQRQRVDAMAERPDASCRYGIGPTIVGKAHPGRQGGTRAGPITLEDGAIPYPMARLWCEMAGTQSFLSRFVGGAASAWHRDNTGRDPLSAPRALGEHSQVLLTMGLDGARGTLSNDGEDGQMVPNWPDADRQDGFFGRLHADFTRVADTAFDGGQYHANPLWKPLPDGFAGVMEGADRLPANLITVHPLGGCAMGHSLHDGVVNTRGQVFRKTPGDTAGTAVYTSLYVLDGAILPGAVGTNPMLTIAALSYCLAADIDRPSAQAPEGSPPSARFEPLQAAWRQLPRIDRREDDAIAFCKPGTDTVSARFSERLFLRLDCDTVPRRSLPAGELPRLAAITRLAPLLGKPIPADATALVLDVVFFLDGEDALEHWAEQPDRPLRAEARISAITSPLVHSSEDVVLSGDPLVTLAGSVNLGRRDTPGRPQAIWRALKTLTRFLRYRPFDIAASIRELFADGYRQRELEKGRLQWLRDTLAGYLRVALLHGEYRYLDYCFTEVASTEGEAIPPGQSVSPVSPLRLAGSKSLAYTPRGDSVFQALLELPLTLSRSGHEPLDTRFRIDLIRITRGPAPLQISAAKNTPEALMALAGVGGYLLRMLAQTHFWSFGAAAYRQMPWLGGFDAARMNAPPEFMMYGTPGRRRRSASRESVTSPDGLVRLVRYRPAEAANGSTADPDPDRRALLLVHGLAHSSEVFWTDTIPENYVQYFLGCGYDVWIVDHRVSANTRLTVDPAHTWDQIALEDLAWAVGEIYATLNRARAPDLPRRQVHVFSHCIGAGAMSMAVLDGRLQQPDNPRESMLASLVPHAVTPWVYASEANRTRENAWSLMKDQDIVDLVEPRLHKETDWFETLADRVATASIDEGERRVWSTWRGIVDRRGPGFARYVYYRYTMFWGRQWNHANITQRLRQRFASMIGPVPIAVIQQVLLSETRQRLVGHEGRNRYVTHQRVQDHWQFPTLFLHGRLNTVFDIESSRLSARLLTELRHAQRAGDGEGVREAEGTALALPADWKSVYAEHGVWLRTFDHYGHMDVIFGKRATRDIGPVLHEFFEAADRHAAARAADIAASSYSDGDYAAFAACYQGQQVRGDDDPRSPVHAPVRPMSGPVLSHVYDDSLRVWVEADDYSTMPGDSVEFIERRADGSDGERPVSVLIDIKTRQPTGTAGKIRDHSAAARDDGVTPLVAPGRFLVSELRQLDRIDKPLAVRVRHTLGQTRLPRLDGAGTGLDAHQQAVLEREHRDIPASREVLLQLHTMPWFRREFLGDADARTGRTALLSFAAGSCLHPGTTFERYRADDIFRGIWHHASAGGELPDGQGLDLLLLLGDQIYADATASLFDPIVRYERFRKRYRMAWNGPWMHRVMAHLPTHFTVDDHAIRNDYDGSLPEAFRHDIVYARHEAWHFQVHRDAERGRDESLCLQRRGEPPEPLWFGTARDERRLLNAGLRPLPAQPGRAGKRAVRQRRATAIDDILSGPPLWHFVERLGLPFFLMDTRFDRTTIEPASAFALFGNIAQINAFERWLYANADKPVLFLCTGAPLAPLSRSLLEHPCLYAWQDGLCGYPGALSVMLELLERHAPGTPLVWLTGDPHISAWADLELSQGGLRRRIVNVVASGLHSPLPFANVRVRDYPWASDIELVWPASATDQDQPLMLRGQQRLLSSAHQQFTRVDLLPGPVLRLRTIGPNGDEIDTERAVDIVLG